MLSQWTEKHKTIEEPLFSVLPKQKSKTNLFRQMKPSVYAVLKGDSATAAQIHSKLGCGTHKQVVMALVELKQEGLVSRSGRTNQVGVWKIVEGNHGTTLS